MNINQISDSTKLGVIVEREQRPWLDLCGNVNAYDPKRATPAYNQVITRMAKLAQVENFKQILYNISVLPFSMTYIRIDSVYSFNLQFFNIQFCFQFFITNQRQKMKMLSTFSTI